MNKKDIDISLVNPFLGAAHDVFKHVFECDLKKGSISLKSNASGVLYVFVSFFALDLSHFPRCSNAFTL